MRSRAILFALCLLLLTAAACLAAPVRVKIVSLDTTLNAVDTQQVRTALMYLQPDVLALQSLRDRPEIAGAPGPVASMAKSLRMYYAYEPAYPGADFGSALLSRYPIAKHAPISASAENKLAGLKADLKVRGATVKVALIRPRDQAEAKLSEAAVAKLVREAQKHRLVLMASFDSNPMDTVKAWGRAGLQDAAVALRKPQPTYPASGPKERLDYFLVNTKMRPNLKSVGVVTDPRLRGKAEHLPIALAIQY
jgi:endonuclease/exonuclease/phosphatase family metal-dependent hydrolase